MGIRNPAPAWHQNVAFGISLVIVTAAIWACAQMLLGTPGTRDAHAGDARRPDGGVRLEVGPWVWTASSGEVIERVLVTAGDATYSFNTNKERGCYAVNGIGTPRIEVIRWKTGRHCQPISCVVVYARKN